MSAALALAVARAMDATAVAAARGAGRSSAREGVLLALLFGLFQAGMAALGWLGGAALGDWIDRWDHWIAFVLLGGLGAKMLWEAREGTDKAEEAPPGNPFGLRIMALLAIATSLDALAVGITLPLLHAPMLLSIATIGVVTAALSMAALWAGRRFGDALGARLEVAGGLVLIGIGTKILLEHLIAG